MTKQTKIIIVAAAVLAVAAVGLFFLWQSTIGGDTNLKTVILEVHIPNQDVVAVEVQTSEQFLIGAMEGAAAVGDFSFEIEGTFVTSVGGYTAVWEGDKEEWWRIAKNGEDLPTGVTETALEDGTTYQFILTNGFVD